MSIMQERHDAAGKRYADAIAEFLEARAELAAFDQAQHATAGFGAGLEIVDLRHGVYLPSLDGSFADQIAAARRRLGV